MLWFSAYDVYTHFVRFTPKRLIIFGGIVSGAVFAILASTSHGDRNFVRWFCIQWICSFHLLVLGRYARSRFFVCKFLEIFYLDHHVTCTQGQYYFLLYDLHTFSFLFFSFRIAMAGICSIVPNSSSESGHPCLLLEVGGKHLLFHHWVGWAQGHSVDAPYQNEDTPSISNLLRIFFIMTEHWILADEFPASIGIIMWLFFL